MHNMCHAILKPRRPIIAQNSRSIIEDTSMMTSYRKVINEIFSIWLSAKGHPDVSAVMEMVDQACNKIDKTQCSFEISISFD